jgi:hypothetical protein
MTVQHSPLGLSDIAYHLYTIFLFTKNDILTAIIPVVRMILTCLYRGSLYDLLDIVFYRLGTALQPYIYIAYYPLDLAPYPAVQPSEPDQGARGRQGEQTLAAPSGRKNFRTRCDDSPVAHGPAVPRILLTLYHPIGVCQPGDAVVYILVQRDGRRQELAVEKRHSCHYVRLYRTRGYPHRQYVHRSPFTLSNSHSAYDQKKGCNPSKVSETGKLAVQLTIAVFTSTVHCQDFKDVEGDRLTGRLTVPIMFPVASRLVVGLGLPIWSYILCCIWDVDWFCTIAFVAYGCFVGGRFLCLRTRDADKRSCKYYSVSARWL